MHCQDKWEIIGLSVLKATASRGYNFVLGGLQYPCSCLSQERDRATSRMIFISCSLGVLYYCLLLFIEYFLFRLESGVLFSPGIKEVDN